MAYIVMAYLVMAIAYIVVAYVVMAYTVMTYTVMAYTVMAYTVMAFRHRHPLPTDGNCPNQRLAKDCDASSIPVAIVATGPISLRTIDDNSSGTMKQRPLTHSKRRPILALVSDVAGEAAELGPQLAVAELLAKLFVDLSLNDILLVHDEHVQIEVPALRQKAPRHRSTQ